MYNGEIRYNENTKKTVTPLTCREIARALREMISEDSPNASEALLTGTREAVFREIFIHYPSFRETLSVHSGR